MTRKLRTTILCLGDFAAAALALFFALLLRMEFSLPPEYLPDLPWFLLIGAGIKVIALFLSRLHTVSHTFISIRDSVRLAITLGIASALLLGIFLVVRGQGWLFKGYPLSAIIIDALMAFLLIGFWRFSKRLVLSIRQARGEGTPTIIVGAGAAADQVLRNMLADSKRTFQPLALLDDDPGRIGSTLQGFPVVGAIEKLPALIRSQGIYAVVIAIPSAPARVIRATYEMARAAGARLILVYPDTRELFHKEFSLRSLRRIELKDLLRRDEITLDEEALGPAYRGKTILVTGAAGSIGSEICRQICRLSPARLILLDREETGLFKIHAELHSHDPDIELVQSLTDIRDRDQILRLLRKEKPEVVFHAAAYKHVPVLESNAGDALANNVGGTLVAARASIESGVRRFVFISTDKAADPVSVMGKTKRIGERLAGQFDRLGETTFVSVRFGNVLGSRGSVLEIFSDQIRSGRPLTVTDPRMKRFFMLVSEAVLLVLHAGAIGKGGEIFVLDMGEPVLIQELAEQMARLAGLEPGRDIPIEITGLRPGERLDERLTSEQERLTPTDHPKLQIALDKETPSFGPAEELLRSVEEMTFHPNGVEAGDVIERLLQQLKV